MDVCEFEIVVYREADGSSPFLDWFQGLPKKAGKKGEVRIERLAQLGHELRRPEADYLGNDIYELRWRFQSVNYRVLYCFYRIQSIILLHGLTKEDKLPETDVRLARKRMELFKSNPWNHSVRFFED